MHGREVDVEDQIAGVVRRLGAEGCDPGEVEAEVRRSFGEWEDAPVREFVPIFAERRVRQRLGLKATPAVAREVVAAP
jgi:hypothetical protein